MKIAVSIFLVAPLLVGAQPLVDQEPQDRTVLLEEFTGIRCNNSPIARFTGDLIHLVYLDDVTLVRIHASSFAIPLKGMPDFRNAWSDELFQHFNVGFLPSGMVGRSLYDNYLVIGESGWITAVDQVLQEPSPVNIGIACDFDPVSRDVTVRVELFYTADGNGESDFVHVLLTEDHIMGYQLDNMSSPPDVWDYDHSKVLRAYITDLWGDEVAITDMGTSVTRNYTYTVPEEFDISNCNMVAYVGKYQGHVHQVREVRADGGTTQVGINGPDVSNGTRAPYPQPASGSVSIPLLDGMHRSVLVVRDMSGRQVHRQSATNATVTVDVSRWSSGSYTYEVISPVGRTVGRLVVVH